LEGKSFEKDSTSTIALSSYLPNHLAYKYNSSKEQLVVFSEIYYSKGWNAYIDGQEVPYLRANYVLRALSVPAGQHDVEFKFEPRIWVVGERISFASSLLLILLLIIGIGFEVKKVIKKTN